MDRIDRIFSGIGQLLLLGIPKPASDPRASRLLLQQRPILLILYILYIDVK